MAEQTSARRPRTLADLYEDRGLTTDQARRIVALLGLAGPRQQTPNRKTEAA